MTAAPQLDALPRWREEDGMTVRTPAPRDIWRRVVAADPAALPEHAPEWIDALCATGPYEDASRLYTFGTREFVLPMVRRRGTAGLGGALQSFPTGWGIGGLVGSDLDDAVVSEVLTDLNGLGAQRIGLRPDPTRWSDWSAASAMATVTVPRRAHVIDLTGGPDAVWSRWSKSARRGTRLAERAGVRIESDRSGALLEQYYGLYLTSVDRWAGKQHEPRALAHARARRRDPLSKLQAMAAAMGDRFMVTLAYVEDQPAFGSITLLGRTAHDTRAAMDRDRVGATCAGDLVQWRTIQLACELGCSAYHLGESGRSESLAQYKEKFGARPYDYAELRLERLPYTKIDTGLRSVVKRVVGFRD